MAGVGRSGVGRMGRRQAGRAWPWVVLLVLGAVGGALFYGYTRPQAVPAWARGWLPDPPGQTRPLYRWRDAQGRVQITDQPPKDRPYEEVRYRADANVMPPGTPRP
ncbi:MAG: DUF4124 domain-containing protein [Candidatus Contendobacter sp.]|nr:DUF4124 domain-containing protein [Candidatus Contendobacter sp.]MDS4057070.1 DUF4124 domain-containing protein [Candidatus Contendobacter sp.]